MKDKEFNLLDEPWIKVIDEECSVYELSLIELFERAHTYKDLCGELPTQDFAMLRLLLAVLHTVFSRYDVDGSESPFDDPDDALDRWQALWENKRFPAEVITKYLETQRDNFYLFHPERPFYQVSEMSKLGKIPNGEYDAQKLNGELAESKNKARLFVSVNGVEKQSLSYRQAARWLLHVNSFDDNALKAGTGIGWLGQLGLIALVGNNLFETLMLNFIAYNINSEDVWEKERPIWENTEMMITQKRHIKFPNNYSELYTLQSRRILLIRSDKRVSGYKILGGDYFDKEETSGYEPMTIWKRQVKGGIIPKEHNSSIQFWREFASIIDYTNIKNGNGDRKPGIILWFKLLLNPNDDSRIISGDYFVKLKIASVKYCGSQRSSIENVFSDSIQLHAALISDMNIQWREVVLNSIQFCESIAKKVWYLARDINLACGGSNSTKESKGTAAFFAERAKADFYNRIDGSFRRWLCTLNPETDHAREKETEWRKRCVDIARQMGNEMISQAGTEAIFGRTLKSSEEKGKKSQPPSAASAMNRFLSGLSFVEKQ